MRARFYVSQNNVGMLKLSIELGKPELKIDLSYKDLNWHSINGVNEMQKLHPMYTLEIMLAFDVNIWAMYYFGILCFNDRPGYFPQLEQHQ